MYVHVVENYSTCFVSGIKMNSIGHFMFYDWFSEAYLIHEVQSNHFQGSTIESPKSHRA